MTRYRPVRAGIIGIWDYDEQVFAFADGRLVLRGANGSGKTKALEVLFPFVLDGSIDPRRLDPFSGHSRTMKSNLVRGERNAGHAFCWMEFRRGADSVTIGVGLSAGQSAEVKTFFFVFDGRFDDECTLLDAERRPRTLKDLRTLLGADAVFDRRDDYRDAVDARLFGLGTERYRAMVELLLTLRRPQLAQGLDPSSLSSVLSGGLRTVDTDLLRSSADAFDHLEEAQRQLSSLERAEQATAELVGHWRAYLRSRAARRLDAVRARRRLCDDAEAEIAALSQQLAAATERVNTAAGEVAEALATIALHQAQIDAARSSAAYQNQGQLEDARRLSTESRKHAELAGANSARAQAEAKEQREREAAAQAALAQAAGETEQRWRTLLAALAAIDAAFDHAGPSLDAKALESSEDDGAREVAIEASLAVQRAAATATGAALDARRAAERALHAADSALSKATADVERLGASLAAARATLEALVAEAEAAVQRAVAAYEPEISAALDVDALVAGCAELERGVELRENVRATLAPLRDRCRDAERDAGRAIVELAGQIGELDRQIEAIASEREDGPPPPPTRSASRDGRAGAPLWRLVRFDESVGPEERAGVEGALLASGLLDAWVWPDGALTSESSGAATVAGDVWWRDDADTAAERQAAARLRSDVATPSLARWLLAEQGGAVERGVVDALLRATPAAAADLRIGTDGSFVLGPIAGVATPAPCRYIGATAREQHRRERIAVAQGERATLVTARDGHIDAQRAAKAMFAAVDAAPGRMPSAAPVRASAAKRDEAQTRLDAAIERERGCRDERDRCQRGVDDADRSFRRACREHGVRAVEASVASLPDAVRHGVDSLGEWRRQRQVTAARADTARASQEQRARLDEGAGRSRAQAEVAERDAAAARKRFDSLSATLGAEVATVQHAIAAAERSRDAAETVRSEAEERRDRAKTEADRVDGRLEKSREALPQRREDLAEALRALRPFEISAVREVLEVAASDAAFDARLAAAIGDASTAETQLKATESRLHAALNGLDDALGERFSRRWWSDDEILFVEIRDDAGAHDLPTFRRRLAERLDDTRALLNARERALFEDQLLTSLCSELADRVDEARALVKAMDAAMRERKLSSRKSFGIAWRAIEGLGGERERLLALLRHGGMLGPTQLDDIRGLLRAEVETQRREHPDRTYLEILAAAVDYRTWHHFELRLLDVHGKAQTLTRKRYGELSGGEKAAALHLPLFAAANAHFEAGVDTAPRLIALDEAFAGIDDRGVPELLRLAVAFDLDFFFTGYDLWLTEAFLPAVMHYDLAHDPIAQAVSAFPILWNGVETVEGPEALR